MIKAILFDLDGTLLDRATQITHCIGEQYERFQRVLTAISKVEYLECFITLDAHGYVAKDKVYRQLVTTFGLPETLYQELYTDFKANYAVHAIGFPYLVETLAILREKGYKLAIISNGQGTVQWEVIKALKIETFFSEVFISEVEGLRKPDPQLFQRALTKLNVTSAEAVFVGDNPQVDIVGAKKSGMWTIWKKDRFWGEIPPANEIIVGLDELPTLIDKINTETLTESK